MESVPSPFSFCFSDGTLARTDKREPHGAGVPVLGRIGIEFSLDGLRFPESGVIGESGTEFARYCSLPELDLGFLVAGENITLTDGKGVSTLTETVFLNFA